MTTTADCKACTPQSNSMWIIGNGQSCACRGRLLFLPPYSPDLNPIEQMFAKLKTLLRKACARTIEATWNGIGECLTHFTPDACANYCTNVGYAST